MARWALPWLCVLGIAACLACGLTLALSEAQVAEPPAHSSQTLVQACDADWIAIATCHRP
jgi:hypothetical protein